MSGNDKPNVSTGYGMTEVRLYGMSVNDALGSEIRWFDIPASLSATLSNGDGGETEGGSEDGEGDVEKAYDDPIKMILKLIGYKSANKSELVIVFAYSFEGHCYTMPKPKLMILPQSREETNDSSIDCGYSKGLGYDVWKVDKLDRCVLLDVEADTVKTLILDANLPGNRSPLTYAQAFRLAPQRNRD